MDGTLRKVWRPARLFLLLTVVLWTAGAWEAMGADAGSSEDRKKSRSTEESMGRLAALLEASVYFREGRYPASTAESDLRTLFAEGYRLRTVLQLQDEWGTPLRIEVTKDRQHIRLVSAGADRRFETYAPLDASVPPRRELDDPAGDIVFVDGDIVQGLKPLPPPDAYTASWKPKRIESSRKLAEVLAAKDTGCALVNEDAVLRLLPPGSDAVRTQSGPWECGWSWWPGPSVYISRTFSVKVFPKVVPKVVSGSRKFFHDPTTGAGLRPPEPLYGKREPESTPRPTSPPLHWTDVEGLADEARWNATYAKLEVRKGRDVFIFQAFHVLLDKQEELLPLVISLARAALQVPASPGPTPKPAPR